MASGQNNVRVERNPRSGGTTQLYVQLISIWNNLSSRNFREEHVERLERRLAAVESQLKAQNSVSSGYHTSPDGDTECIANSRSAATGGKAVSYHGSSSFAKQSIQAREIAQSIADSRPAGELGDSLNTLNTLLYPTVGLASTDTYRLSSNSSSESPPKMLSLPVEVTAAIVREIKSRW